MFKTAVSILMSAIFSFLTAISVPLKSESTLNRLHFVKMEEGDSSAYGMRDYILVGEDGEVKEENDFSFSLDGEEGASLPSKYDSDCNKRKKSIQHGLLLGVRGNFCGRNEYA